MTGCLTRIEYEYPEYELPDKPARTQQSKPVTKIEFALLFNYYEHHVKEWEEWAEKVEEILRPPD